LNLQVFTNDASGIAHWNTPFAILNSEIRCLYQPWGTPFEFEKWQNSIPTNRTKTEYWIGAIWNNALMQGNSEVIAKFREALRANGIDFKRIGGSRIRISGLSDEKAATFIRKSTLGAVIVGDWQRSAAYIPCRLFKNLSSGIPPILNFDLESMFGGSQLFKSDVSELVTAALDESDSSRQQRLEESQFRARLFTYKEGINRILNSLEMTQSH
jgi:hypothetical protein